MADPATPVPNSAKPRRKKPHPATIAAVVYVIAGVLEGLLLFRFIFQLLGANPETGFVNFIYGITGPFVEPFYGIFGQGVNTPGTVTTGVFDPAILVAMLVYALIGWAVVQLFSVLGRPQP